MIRVHAFGDDALGDLDAVGVVEALRDGAVSRAEVVEAAITRTEKLNPELNGLAYAAFDEALARATSTVPYGGFFDGVPTFVKDNVDVAGMPTLQGTDAWDPRPATVDGAFARLYRSTGVIPLGKSQMSEFGFSGAAEHPRLGPVRNPWDTLRTVGASSSGSAAFVGAGAVPIAHANDGGGSIRIPASCAGLVGLKPSRGRLPLDDDVRHMPVQIIANGVVTRSVRDTAAFYREAEKTLRTTTLPPIGDVTGPARRRLQVAVVTRSLARQAAPEVRDLTLETASMLESLGHRVEYVDRPPIPSNFADDFVLYWGLLSVAVVRGGRRSFGDSFNRGRLDNLTLGLDLHTSRNLYRLPLAIARLRAARRHTAKFFRSYDVLLTPTLADEPPMIGHLDPMADYDQIISRLTDWVAYTPLQNVTGEPAISLPLAQSASGLPIGMMFSAAIGHEALLLRLAYELEEAKPLRRIQD